MAYKTKNNLFLEAYSLDIKHLPWSDLGVWPLKLGCSKRQAIFTALSRKSYWHLSKTFATQVGMTNQWIKKQGLISIKEL